jgi:cyclophilin family peptidyl-prolyl cis-trans isomerase
MQESYCLMLRSLPLLLVIVLVGLTPCSFAAKWWPWQAEPSKPPAAPAVATQPQRVEQTPYALIETQRGNLVVQLYPQAAPKTVANFVRLVQQGFYNQNGMNFHRVVPGFVVQTGDPTGTGEGGSEQTIPLEVQNKLSHDSKGVVAMARTFAPNSATSQFYITLTSQRNLDGKYAIFGKVIRGQSVLDSINKGDKLYGVRLITAKELPPEEPKSIMGIKIPPLN